MKLLLLLLLFAQTSCSLYREEKPDSLRYSKFIEDVETVRTKHFSEIKKDAFREFVTGYLNSTNRKKITMKHTATIIDYSKSSNEKRLYVLDLKKMKIAHTSLVAHGRNSGNEFANSFSNRDGSKMSSTGFLATMKTYQGQHGYSLKLKGLEKRINDNALKRAIVVHGAEYVSQEFVRKHGRLGRSWGCPALPADKNREIIDAIKGGSLIYIYCNKNKTGLRSDLRVVSKKTIETFYALFGDLV